MRCLYHHEHRPAVDLPASTGGDIETSPLSPTFLNTLREAL